MDICPDASLLGRRPPGQVLCRTGRCLREAPVTLTVDDVLIEGIVDCAFDTPDGVVVIDFKTDRELDGAIDRYRRQVGLYAAAIGSAMRRPVRAVLMRL